MSKKNPPQRGAIVLIFESPPREISVHSAFNQCTALLIFSEMWTENKPEKRGGSLSSLIVRRWLMFLLCSSCSTPPVGLYPLWAFSSYKYIFPLLLGAALSWPAARWREEKWPLFCLSALLLFRFPGRGHCAHPAGPVLLCVAGSSLS